MVKIAIEVDNTNSQEMTLDVRMSFAEGIGVVGEFNQYVVVADFVRGIAEAQNQRNRRAMAL